MGAKHPPGAPPRRGRVGSDHLNAQMPQGLPKLGQALFVNLAACVRHVPVMAAPARLKTAKQTTFPDHLVHPAQTAHRALFGHEKHRVVFAGGIVHRHNQLPRLPGTHS